MESYIDSSASTSHSNQTINANQQWRKFKRLKVKNIINLSRKIAKRPKISTKISHRSARNFINNILGDSEETNEMVSKQNSTLADDFIKRENTSVKLKNTRLLLPWESIKSRSN